jgi:GNAT superfamily N-acetyltransferase
MSDLSIRQATRADWPRIWPVWREVVATGDTYAYDPETPSDEAQRLWLRPAPDETWLASSDGGAVLGTYHLAPNHGGPGSHIANASYMVAAAARRRGIGRAMVEHSLQRCVALGYLGLQFNAVASTNVDAVTLYEHLGFATIGVVPRGFRHPTAGLVDLLIMHREVAGRS